MAFVVLGWVQGRQRERVHLVNGQELALASLDEALFAIAGVVDFQVVLKRSHDRDHLNIKLFSDLSNEHIHRQATACLKQIPAVETACTDSTLVLEPIAIENGSGLTRSTAKRRIIIQTS